MPLSSALRMGIRTSISQSLARGGGGILNIYDDRSRDDMPADTDYTGTWTGWDNPSFRIGPEYQTEDGKFGSGVAVSSGTTEEGGDLTLQVGPLTEDILKVRLPNTSTWSLGIGPVSVATQARASGSMASIKDAVDYLSTERGRMGAYQNRLEHISRSLAVNHENFTNVESRIRDTDMADEITSFTKNNILQQAAFSMLAQANAVPNGVLGLLQ